MSSLMSQTETAGLKSERKMVKAYYHDDYATIALDDSIPCVTLTLRGIPRSSEHYQLVQQKRIELMRLEIKNYPKLHMLTDSSVAGPVLDEDVNYFKEKVLQEIELAGIRFLAIVMPKNKFTQLTVRDMTQNARILKVRYFETMREARHWLRKMTLA
jgi:hypothetical protein